MLTLNHSNNILVYVVIAFVTMSGLSYINFLPGVVTALAVGLGYTEAQAGQVVAMNGYGGILGSVIAVLSVAHIPWKTTLMITMSVLMVFDVSTATIIDYPVMLIWRFIAGVLGGVCVGIGVSVMARLDKPDRAFGLLLLIQFGVGTIVMALLPSLENIFNSYAVFYAMFTILALSLACLFVLGQSASDELVVTSHRPVFSISSRGMVLLIAMGFYQSAASAIWAYVGLVGVRSGFNVNQISQAIAITGVFGFLGALLPVLIGKRRGRFFWVIGSILLSLISVFLFLFSRAWVSYVLAMSFLFLSWPAFQSYLLAVTAELDSSGRLSTVASAVTSVGLASGPLIGSFLIEGKGFTVMLVGCAVMFLVSLLILIKPIWAQDKAAMRIGVSLMKGRVNND